LRFLLGIAFALSTFYTFYPGDVLYTGTPDGVSPVKPGDIMVARIDPIGEMRVSFNPARHPVETNAIAVVCDGARFVFTGDSNTDALLELFCENADLLLADAAFLEEEWAEAKPHMSALRAARLAKEANARALYLTHLPVRHEPATLVKEAQAEYPRAQAVFPGLVIRL
jgi:ribonuclease BN (tRNA processing enzyme)